MRRDVLEPMEGASAARITPGAPYKSLGRGSRVVSACAAGRVDQRGRHEQEADLDRLDDEAYRNDAEHGGECERGGEGGGSGGPLCFVAATPGGGGLALRFPRSLPCLV